MSRYAGVVIDYGHGGEVPSTGASLTAGKEYTFTGYNGFTIREGVTNRMTAARLMNLLLERGYRVYDAVARSERTRSVDCWRELEQNNVSLADRVNYANAQEGVFYLSLHSNAIGSSSKGPSLYARGVMFFTSHGKTRSDDIATSLHQSFEQAFADENVSVRRGDWSDGDSDHEENFYVLRKTACPAVLGEVLFFTNETDARYLLSDHGQDTIALAYLRGIEGWLKK